MDDIAILFLDCVDQPLGLSDRQITSARLTHALERLYSTPCIIRRNLPVSPGAVERGLENDEHFIRRYLSATQRLGIVANRPVLLRLAFRCPLARWHRGEAAVPLLDLVF